MTCCIGAAGAEGTAGCWTTCCTGAVGCCIGASAGAGGCTELPQNEVPAANDEPHGAHNDGPDCTGATTAMPHQTQNRCPAVSGEANDGRVSSQEVFALAL